jgi:DNA-binding transcriptional LysR family regulator
VVDRFEAMQAFVRVVESGGITAAAQRLGLAKSAISRRLQELENHLGVQLLQRTTRSVRMTEDGRNFYQRCLRILEELEEAENSLSSEQQRVHGLLRVAAPLSFCQRHLMPLLDEFLHRYPEVRLELNAEDREINVIEERMDVTIRIGKLDDSSLVARRLAPVRLVVCASPAYLERFGTPERPEELVVHQGLAYSNIADQQQWTLVDRGGLSHTVIPQTRLRVNNGDLILEALLAGLGIAVMPTFICHRELSAGTLRQILNDYTSASSAAAYALYPSRRHLPLRVRVFIDFLAERLGDNPPWERELD